VHPDYNRITSVNDIALIKLHVPALIEQNNIAPICLPFVDSMPPILQIIGYGLRNKTSGVSDFLLRGTVKTMTSDECKMKMKNLTTQKVLTENHICVESTKSNNLNCIGND
jgi:hypothetical protein